MAPVTVAMIRNRFDALTDYAARLDLIEEGTRLYLKEGTPSVGLPWEVQVIHPLEGHYVSAPDFLPGMDIGMTRAEAWHTLRVSCAALYSAVRKIEGTK